MYKTAGLSVGGARRHTLEVSFASERFIARPVRELTDSDIGEIEEIGLFKAEVELKKTTRNFSRYESIVLQVPLSSQIKCLQEIN